MLVLAAGVGWAETTMLFHETFGNNTGSARTWDDSYSVKSGVSNVYSGITSYTVSNAKQSKNTGGYVQSGLNQSAQGTDAYIIIGPLNVADYNSLGVTYYWKAGSIKGTYSTHLYYATSANGTYSEVTGTGAGATTFVQRSYTMPQAAQVSTLYLKIVWNTSNTQAVIDEVELTGTYAGGSTTTYSISGTGTTTGGEITASQTSGIIAGSTVTLTATPDTGYELTEFFVGATDVFSNMTDNGDGSYSYVLTVNADVTLSATFSPVSGGSTEYVLVENASDLVAGSEYIIANEDGSVLMGALNGSGDTYANEVTSGFSTSSDYKTITLESYCTAMKLTLGGNAGAWTLNNGSGYIAYTKTNTSSNNYLMLVSNASDNGATWAISGFPSSQTLISNVYNTSRSIRYNSQNTRFAAYVSGQAAVALYKKVEAPKTYDVTVTQGAHGTITVSPVGEKVVNSGDKITVTADPDPGYELDTWTITGAQESAPDSNDQITATGNVTITATFSKIQYSITNVVKTNGEDNGNGGGLNNFTGVSTVNGVWGAQIGDVVTFTADTYQGYQMLQSGISIKDADGNDVSFTFEPNNGNRVTFTMPASNVTVTANFTYYRPTLKLAGRFNGNTSWRTGSTARPEFGYDSQSDKYTIYAYFTGEGEGNYFFLTSDNDEKHPTSSGNWQCQLRHRQRRLQD